MTDQPRAGTETATVTLSKEAKDRLAQMARERGMTIAQLVAHLLKHDDPPGRAASEEK